MNSLKTPFALFVLLLSMSIAAAAQPESPAVARLKALIEVVNSHDRQAATKFITENYAAAFLNIPMDQHLNFIFGAWERSRGYDFHSIQDVTADSATALVKNRLTGEWEAVAVRIEAEAPHKISGIGSRPPKPPAQSSQLKKLTDAEIAGEIDSYVRKLADADVFSGTVLIANGDKVIFKKAYGTANKDFNSPNTIDTKFNLGSMNKMFTSVAIAQLVERGKLSFDDPLSKFLPEFPNKQAAEKIRIKHLLTHTAGLGSYFNKKFFESSRARFRSVDDMMQLADEKDVAFEPGSKWAYSNTGMLVLGKVIEKASGQNYFDYIRENIYKPAGMINSDCYELDTVNKNLAVGYSKVFTEKGMMFRNNVFEHVMRGGPAGGGYSTVEDLFRFSQALMSGKLVKPEMVRLFTSAKPDLNSPNYGYGFQVNVSRGTIGHSGGFPGISSNLSIFLDSGYVTVVMSNYGRGSDPIDRRIEELLAGNE